MSAAATATATGLFTFRRSFSSSTSLTLSSSSSRRQQQWLCLLSVSVQSKKHFVSFVGNGGGGGVSVGGWMSLSSISCPVNTVRRSSSTTATTATTSAAPQAPEAAVFERIALIGTGKMAHAILKPLIGQNIQPAQQICVYDVSTAAMERIVDEYPGIVTSQNIPEALHMADLVLLCLKPQNLTTSFFDQICLSHPTKDAILLSIIAGKPISFFIDGSRNHFTKIVRSMPNTPAMIGQGMTVWSATTNLCTLERNKIKKILSGFGKAVCLYVLLHCVCVFVLRFLLQSVLCAYLLVFFIAFCVHRYSLFFPCQFVRFRKPTLSTLLCCPFIHTMLIIHSMTTCLSLFIYSYTWTMKHLLTWPQVFLVLVQPIFLCSWKV
jgi:NADP oxidoreductase coenzyme F420-dependent